MIYDIIIWLTAFVMLYLAFATFLVLRVLITGDYKHYQKKYHEFLARKYGVENRLNTEENNPELTIPKIQENKEAK